jgi:hypothetical protein
LYVGPLEDVSLNGNTQAQPKMERVSQTDFVDLHAQLYPQCHSASSPFMTFWISIKSATAEKGGFVYKKPRAE